MTEEADGKALPKRTIVILLPVVHCTFSPSIPVKSAMFTSVAMYCLLLKLHLFSLQCVDDQNWHESGLLGNLGKLVRPIM